VMVAERPEVASGDQHCSLVLADAARVGHGLVKAGAKLQ
jgi:hypothetical protein